MERRRLADEKSSQFKKKPYRVWVGVRHCGDRFRHPHALAGCCAEVAPIASPTRSSGLRGLRWLRLGLGQLGPASFIHQAEEVITILDASIAAFAMSRSRVPMSLISPKKMCRIQSRAPFTLPDRQSHHQRGPSFI